MGKRLIFALPILNYVLMKAIRKVGLRKWGTVNETFKEYLKRTDVYEQITADQMDNYQYCLKMVTNTSCKSQYNKLVKALKEKKLITIAGGFTDKVSTIIQEVKKVPIEVIDSDVEDEDGDDDEDDDEDDEEEEDEEDEEDGEIDKSDEESIVKTPLAKKRKINENEFTPSSIKKKQQIADLTVISADVPDVITADSTAMDIEKIRTSLLSVKKAIDYAIKRLDKV